MTQDVYKVVKHSHLKQIDASNGVLKYNIYLLEDDERKKTSLVLTFNELQSLMGLCLYYNKSTLESKHLLMSIIDAILKTAGMKADRDKMHDNNYGKIYVLLPDDKEGLIVF